AEPGELPRLRREWEGRHKPTGVPDQKRPRALKLKALHALTLKVLLGRPAGDPFREKMLREAQALEEKPARNRVRRGKRAMKPPVAGCKRLLEELLAQGVNTSRELERICCEENKFSRHAFFAARRELGLRPRRRGYGKGGRWELLPE